MTVRLNINLATKPYQDIRRVLLQWGGLVVLLAVCTMALCWYAVSSWRESRDVNAKIATLETELAALDRQQADAVAVLRNPQNSSVVETSKFLNGLIARKSFSWTRVFMQLEAIMPPRLHVVSITPELQPKTNTVEVHLTVAGTSRQAAVELVKRLEQSPSFRDARITEEREALDKESLDTVEFQVTAVYVPRPAPPEAATRTVEDSTVETPSAEPHIAQTGGTR
ncbi:MAG TPA: PilN domain-containing protein [Candidatus Saccharimonadales bacterium]|nr:PilN domain-containing protein [Candidatus Saccharimonadales bacterium]